MGNKPIYRFLTVNHSSSFFLVCYYGALITFCSSSSLVFANHNGQSLGLSQGENSLTGAYIVDDPQQFDPVSGLVTLYKVVPLPESPNIRYRRAAPEVTGTSKDTKESNKNITNSNATITTNTSIVSVTTAKSVVVNVVPIGNHNNTSISNGTVLSTTAAPQSKTSKPGPGTVSNHDLDDDWFPRYPAEIDYPKNYTTKNDTHKYYNSSYFRDGKFLWVELDDHSDAVKHELLSNAHRRAATVNLKFDFPFYGHMVRNVTMATGGFVYLGEQVHAWLAATQYVAPLMANFHSTWDNATVRYLSNSTQFTVEWDHVHIHGEDSSDSGAFTFQTSLYSNGTIVFAYKDIPIEIKKLNDTHHPVKVGLSDAYITDKTLLFVKSRTIFEYDRVDLKDYEIVNGSAIAFTPLPTCLGFKTCHECLAAEIGFKCSWCPKNFRCSDGTDRYRQDWLMRGCTLTSFDTPLQCFMGTTTGKPSPSSDVYHNIGNHDGHDDHVPRKSVDNSNTFDDHYHEHHDHQSNSITNPQKVKKESNGGGMSASGVVGLMFFFMVLFGGVGWVLYAYYYPHSPSGQMLIRFRPSQWGAFRRGEARYTAASIHM